MKIEILTLCEYASESEGRLSVIDTFDTIKAAKFPWRAYFYVAAKIDIADYDIENKKNLNLEIYSEDNDDAPIFQASSPFKAPQNLRKLNVVAGLKGLIFEKEGKYFIRLKCDDATIAELPFNVALKQS